MCNRVLASTIMRTLWAVLIIQTSVPCNMGLNNALVVAHYAVPFSVYSNTAPEAYSDYEGSFLIKVWG